MASIPPPENDTMVPPPSFVIDANLIPGYVLQLLATAFYGCVLIAVNRIRNSNTQGIQFYHLFFYIGLADFLHALTLIWMSFDHDFIQGDAFSGITFVCSYANCFFYLFNILGNGLLAINRYSATFIHHPAHFSMRRTKIYLGWTAGLAFVSSIPAMFRERAYSYIDGKWMFTLTPIWLIKTQRHIILVWMVLYFIVAPVFTVMTRQRIQNFMYSVKYHKSDESLLLFNAAHMICHSSVFLFEVFEIYEPNNNFIKFIHTHFYGFLFSAVVLNAFFIVFTTSRVRKELTKIVCHIYEKGKSRVSNSNQTIQVFQISRY